MDKIYVLQIVFSGAKGNGISYQCLSAKNKKEAVKIALTKNDLPNYKCVLLSIKRISKKLVDIVEKHNNKLKEIL